MQKNWVRRFTTALWLRNAAAIGALLICSATATAQNGGGIPCRYEIAHIIQGPICPVTQSPAVTVGTAISPKGRWVVGNYRLCGPSNERGFIYDTTNGQFTPLPHPNGISISFCNDVNDAGKVVGQAMDNGFIYDIPSGQFTFLSPGVATGGTCKVNGINASNVVCGTRTIQTSPSRTSAFRWSAQTGFEDVGLINGESTLGWSIAENGDVVGHAPENTLSTIARAFVYSHGTAQLISPIPNGVNSRTRICSPDGTIVVSGMLTSSPSGPTRSFTYRDTYLYMFEPPPNCSGGGPLAVNSSMIGVGAGCNPNGGSNRAIVWFGSYPRVLNDMIAESQVVWLEIAMAIDEGGRIVCNTTNTYREGTRILSPVHRKAGDTDCDGLIGVADILNVIQHWGLCGGCDEDFNLDGSVGVPDLLNVIANWNPHGEKGRGS